VNCRYEIARCCGSLEYPAGCRRRANRPRTDWPFGAPPRFATVDAFDGRFNFCRVVFRQNPYGDGNGWGVDYPRADQDLSIRLSELTRTPVSFDREGNPIHFLVRLTDDELFHCPFIMMTEVGSAYLHDREAAKLRDYLLKGGFLWADDFWGSYAWHAWESQIRKVLPAKDFPIIDLPIEHPMFHTLFDVQRVPQIPSIDSWECCAAARRNAGRTAPRCIPARSSIPRGA
jgi:Domain of unknown function (DUF4159)